MSSTGTFERISDQTWEAIKAEFTLPALEQVRRRLSELVEDPEPVMRHLVRDLFTGLSGWLTARVAAWEEPCQRHALVMDFWDRSSDRQRAEGLTVANVGRVIPRSGVPGFVVLDAKGEEFAPATEYLLELTATDRSPQTVRTYALSLLRFLRFLWAVGVSWEQATSLEARDFVLWARQADKFVGNRNVPQRRGGPEPCHGKEASRNALLTLDDQPHDDGVQGVLRFPASGG